MLSMMMDAGRSFAECRGIGMAVVVSGGEFWWYQSSIFCFKYGPPIVSHSSLSGGNTQVPPIDWCRDEIVYPPWTWSSKLADNHIHR